MKNIDLGLAFLFFFGVKIYLSQIEKHNFYISISIHKKFPYQLWGSNHHRVKGSERSTFV